MVRLTIPAVWSIAVVWTVAISCWPSYSYAARAHGSGIGAPNSPTVVGRLRSWVGPGLACRKPPSGPQAEAVPPDDLLGGRAGPSASARSACTKCPALTQRRPLARFVINGWQKPTDGLAKGNAGHSPSGLSRSH